MAINSDTSSGIWKDLINAWMSGIPTDPLKNSSFTWLWNNQITWWFYWYIVTKRNWTDDAWFVLMAKTEVEWWSNWVVCKDEPHDLSGWYIQNTDDISQISLCSSVSQDTSKCSAEECTYKTEEELRYIIVY